jgi:hypothetical protein
MPREKAHGQFTEGRFSHWRTGTALRRAYLNILIPIADSIFFAGGALYKSRRRRREPVAMLAAFVLGFICCDDPGPGFGLGTLLSVVVAVDGFTAVLDWLAVCSGADG